MDLRQTRTRACSIETPVPCDSAPRDSGERARQGARCGSMADLEPRKGSPDPTLDELEFKRRFLAQYVDPAFAPLRGELDRIAAAAWDGYKNSRKAPVTRKAGPEFE